MPSLTIPSFFCNVGTRRRDRPATSPKYSSVRRRDILPDRAPPRRSALGATNSSCAATVSSSRDPASAVRRSTPWIEAAARSSADAGAAGAQPVEQEQRGDGIARAVDRDRQQRRAHPPGLAAFRRQQVERRRRRLRRAQRGQQHAARPAGLQIRRSAALASASVAMRRPVSHSSLELVGRGDIGQRQRAVAEESGMPVRT